MDLIEAIREFQIRFYRWATSEFETEIDESFPRLRTFKTGPIWETYQFMQQLNKHDQRTLARALLKRSHSDASKALGEDVSDREKLLCSQRDDFFRIKGLYDFVRCHEKNKQIAEARAVFDRFRSSAIEILGGNEQEDDKNLLLRLDAVFNAIPPTFEDELAARRENGEKIKFASKRKLQAAAMKAFRNAFGSRCINFRSTEKTDPSSQFEMECCGWIVSTQFWFGRREGLISYTHLIASPTRTAHPVDPEITAPDMVLAFQISFCGWLGIYQTEWGFLTDDEVEPVCDKAIKLCGDFFKVAPELLKGLEFEKISSQN